MAFFADVFLLDLFQRYAFKDAMGQAKDKTKLFHQIRNALNPVFTFVQMVDTSAMEPHVQTFQETCKKHCEEALNLLKKMEERE